MTRSRIFWLSLVLCGAFGAGRLHAQQITSDLRSEALQALKKAATHYHAKMASHGGYVYYYSVDLQERWGEGKAEPDTIFVQPPGTPTVGMAYLKAYAATRDRFYLDAAREAAEALVYGQLQSGGWTQVIQFAEAKPLGKYRNRRGGSRNSSLDDGQTQAALILLIRADQALDFKHAEIHEAANYGLQALLQAQFPNGAFPQVWTGPVESKPVSKARFPDYDWKTEGRIKNYWDYYTLNDNLAGTVSDTLIAAHQVYKDEKYKAALERLGDFLITRADARAAARLVPAIQLRDDPHLGAEVRTACRYRLGVPGRAGDVDQNLAIHGPEQIPRTDPSNSGVFPEVPPGGRDGCALLRVQDE